MGSSRRGSDSGSACETSSRSLYARSGTSPGTGGPFGAALVTTGWAVLRSADGRRLQRAVRDLLTGSYDCVDRIVLNAYYPMRHGPGGFRLWWRRLHNGSEEQLDDNHLMRMAGRFARRVKAWGAANEVPVIYCKSG